MNVQNTGGKGWFNVLLEYNVFFHGLFLLRLEEVNSMRPLLDGKQLSKGLGVKPGPWMKEALDIVMAWQLSNWEEKDTEGALEEVRKHRTRLGI